MEPGTASKRERHELTPERWELVKRIIDETVELPEADRSTFVRRQCSGDTRLEEEIQQLLATYERTAITLELGAAATLEYPHSQMGPHVLEIGQFISGRFGILRFINRGGMGEVYEAWDPELQDRVALKTIRQEVASIPSIIERFKQEVRQARGISHPNVCRVYDLFSHDLGPNERLWFLTMELIVGQTLSERLRGYGPLRPEEALGIVEQMVAGLAAAHDLGIVHRDFKSSNVMLVPISANKTRAVITDFGLALNVSTENPSPKDAGRGGTPAYMAPEQARGDKVGFAADQYALGIVICEMLTGHRPKRASGDADTKTLQFPTGGAVKPRWEAAIRRCLQTNPEQRFKHVKEVAGVLHPRRMRTRVEAWGMGIAVGLLVLAIAIVAARQNQIRVEGLAELTPGTDFSTSPSISGDGQVIAYTSDRAEAGNLDIWLQRLPAGVPVRITRDPAEDKYPSLSPDGTSIVFRSERDGGGIYIADSARASQRLLMPAGRNPQFSPDGRRVAYWVGDKDDSTPSGKLYVLSLADGRRLRVAASFSDARWPIWSSDGVHILFYGCRGRSQPMPACLDWWITDSSGDRVENTGAFALLRQANVEPVEELGGWYGDTVIFTAKHAGTTSIWGLQVSQKNLRAEGKPKQLTSGVSRDVDPSLAQNGTLVFSHLSGALHIWRIANASNPKRIEAGKVTEDAGTDSTPSISHDGHWLLFSRVSGARRDLWLKNTVTGAESVFEAPGSEKISPVIDDFGKLVAFEARDGNVPAVYVADSRQASKKLCVACSKPTGWFDQNRAVFYRAGAPSAIHMAEPETGKTETVVESPEASLSEANWSPESQYLLFTASKGGENKQVFTVHFPKATGKATGKWIAITDSSHLSDRPKWSGDGKTIFYLSTRDGFSCIWGQRFDRLAGKIVGSPFAVMHYHNLRISPARVTPRSFDLSVSGDTIYLNLGEETASLWTGILKPAQKLAWPF